MKICKPSHFTVSDLVAGVDVILDIIGVPYLTRNLEALGMDGRLYILGMQSGPRGDVDIAAILKKRITIACKCRLNCTFFFIFWGCK
jgi:NADPH:quinone reductase-like Zn-dependent oxidoreductase